MRLLRILERIFLIHRNLDRAACDHLEQLIRRLEQVLALGGIIVERRTSGEQRALRLQNIDVEGVDRPEALPKLTNMPSGLMQSSEAGKVALPTPS